MRGLTLIPFLAATLALGGCAASIAAGALGAALRSGQGDSTGDPGQGQAAAEACHARASQYGAVHIIDVEQRSAGKVVVWGTVEGGGERRSFECGYGKKVTGFKLRPITATQ